MESTIIKGCLEKDRNSQKMLYELLYGKVLGVCLRFSKNYEEANSMMQEGFITIFGSIKSLRENTSFESWTQNIILKTAIDYLQRNKHEYGIVSTVVAHQKTAIWEKEINESDILKGLNFDIVLKSLQQLSPAYRIVYNLSVIEGCSHKDISERLGISEDTSKSNLAKAKINLRKNLSQLIFYNEGR